MLFRSLGGATPAVELYDLQADPDEMTNLAGDKAMRPELERMFAALKRWGGDTQDTSAQRMPLPIDP